MSVDVPQSWLRILLNDVGEIVTGKTPSTKDPQNFGGSIPFVKPADLDNGGYVTRTADTLTDLGATLVPTVPANSIPVTCIGNLGKVGITNQTSATNQQINTVVPSSQVDYRFFYYQLQTLKPWMQENASATTVTIINKGKFSKAPVTLAPLAEQKVIADKLDTLLAQVETTKTRLERIPQILKRFRQSVLAAAVSGRLTEDLGNEFQEVAVEDVAKEERYSLGIGPFGSHLKVSDYRESGHPLVFVREIRSKRFGDAATKFVSGEKFKALSAHRVCPGDILITKMGDPPGDVAIYPLERPEAVITSDCIKLSVNELIADRDYVAYAMQAESFRRSVLSISAGVAQQKVSLTKFRKLRFLLPTLEEQTQIVQRVNQLFTHADRIEQQVQAALERVNHLTQSILAKAFRGELTEQWRKDNPELISGENSAAALLERIKAERAAMQPAKKGRRTKMSS